MIRKIKQWLYDRFLPMWAKETVLADNCRLKREIDRLEAENERLRAYVDGMNAGTRSLRRIIINTGSKEDKKE